MPTGKHFHLPFNIVKQVDHTTPKLYQFLGEGDILKEVIIEWYRINTATSKEEAYCRQTLQNVMVNAVSFRVSDDHGNPNNIDAQSSGHMEHVSFMYEGICWLYHDGGIEFCDGASGQITAPNNRSQAHNQTTANKSIKQKDHYVIIELNKDPLAWPIKDKITLVAYNAATKKIVIQQSFKADPPMESPVFKALDSDTIELYAVFENMEEVFQDIKNHKNLKH